MMLKRVDDEEVTEECLCCLGETIVIVTMTNGDDDAPTFYSRMWCQFFTCTNSNTLSNDLLALAFEWIVWIMRSPFDFNAVEWIDSLSPLDIRQRTSLLLANSRLRRRKNSHCRCLSLSWRRMWFQIRKIRGNLFWGFRKWPHWLGHLQICTTIRCIGDGKIFTPNRSPMRTLICSLGGGGGGGGRWCNVEEDGVPIFGARGPVRRWARFVSQSIVRVPTWMRHVVEGFEKYTHIELVCVGIHTVWIDFPATMAAPIHHSLKLNSTQPPCNQLTWKLAPRYDSCIFVSFESCFIIDRHSVKRLHASTMKK